MKAQYFRCARPEALPEEKAVDELEARLHLLYTGAYVPASLSAEADSIKQTVDRLDEELEAAPAASWRQELLKLRLMSARTLPAF